MVKFKQIMAQYINKDALVAEIDNMLKTKEQTSHLDNDAFNSGRWKALKKVKDILDALEVKEVDLEKEIYKWWLGKTRQTYGMVLNPCNIRDFAKHFFELGMQVSSKAQKGE